MWFSSPDLILHIMTEVSINYYYKLSVLLLKNTNFILYKSNSISFVESNWFLFEITTYVWSFNKTQSPVIRLIVRRFIAVFGLLSLAESDLLSTTAMLVVGYIHNLGQMAVKVTKVLYRLNLTLHPWKISLEHNIKLWISYLSKKLSKEWFLDLLS
jgi:hypothetical protein